MDRRQSRWQMLSAGVAITVLLASGAFGAAANFVNWPVAVGLGAVSAGGGLAGTLWWDRYTARAAMLRDWAAVTDPGPGDDPAPTESLLAALNPDQEVVGFSTMRDPDVRLLLRWCAEPTDERLWLVAGPAGCGKTRLLIETVARLDQRWLVGWARRGHGAAAVERATAWRRPVVIVIDDADTHPELVEILIAAASVPTVRVMAATRDASEWWPRLRESLPPHVDVRMPARPQTSLGSLTTDAATQQQRFGQAVRAFSRARGEATPPDVRLVPPSAPAPLVVIHAAAAVAVQDNLSGPVDLITALNRLFTIEEAWWRQRAVDDHLSHIGLPTLRCAVVAAVVLGADDLADAVRILGRLPGLTAAREPTLRELALWLRRLYPNKDGGWLDPHLPARLAEYYIAEQLAANPPLAAAIATATLPPGP